MKPGRFGLGGLGQLARDAGRHFGPRKLTNALASELGYRLRTRDPIGDPTALVVDLTTHCQLRCPLCPTGLGREGRTRQHIPSGAFRKLVDRYARTSLRLFLTDWGEPLLHPDVAALVAYAEDRGLWTAISTNGLFLPDELATALVAARLSHATFSIDGATQEPYARYRVRGDLETVLANLTRLIAARNRAGSRRPHVTWQFLVFRHNQHEIDAARAKARELGVRFEARGAGLGVRGETPHESPSAPEALAWLVDDPRWPDSQAYFDSTKPYLDGRHCWWLWKALVVSPNGSTPPCCCTFEERHDVGNAFAEDPERIRRSPRARRMRAVFRRAALPPGEPVACERCDVFRRSAARAR